MKTDTKLKAEITARLLATQLSQIQLWKADAIDIVKLTQVCAAIADDCLTEAAKYQSIAPGDTKLRRRAWAPRAEKM